MCGPGGRRGPGVHRQRGRRRGRGQGQRQKEVLAVTIKPEAVDPEDVEMLQDLVVSAVNEALRQAGEAMDKSIEQATGGLDLGAFRTVREFGGEQAPLRATTAVTGDAAQGG